MMTHGTRTTIAVIAGILLAAPVGALASEYFTEYWGGAGVTEDIAYHQLTFTPNGSPDFYGLCVEPAYELPVDPSGGTIFEDMTEWDYDEVTLADGKRVWIYGESYSTIYVGSSGFITFTQGDPDGWVSLYSHFSLARVSAVGAWLYPYENVSWQQLDDRVVATWDHVYEHWIAGGGPSTCQIELYFDGRIRVTILEVGVYDPMVTGLSEGNGIPPDFVETDFTEYGCDAVPPWAYDVTAVTPQDTPIVLELPGDDDGLPDPPGVLDTIVVSLPTGGTLYDTGAGIINAVPYTLVANGNEVEYVPDPGYGGVDYFEFKVNDGGEPFDGGDSLTSAQVAISVAEPRMVLSFPFDEDPGWTTEGLWAFGPPLGQGSHNHDPTSGYTGDNVYGYNLAGDYENDLPPTYLTTTSIECSQLGAVELRFRRWLGIETTWFDHASIEASNDGEDWTLVWDLASSNLSETSWSYHAYDISSIADGEPTVYIRWVMGPTNFQNTYPGWNIDDVEIWALAPICLGVLPGDVNGDGLTDGADIQPFVAVLLDSPLTPSDPQTCAANVDGNGTVDTDDIPAFVQKLLE